MRRLLFAFAFTLLGTQAKAWDPLSEAEFRKSILSSSHVLVAFILPSHGGSQDLQAEWASVEASTGDKTAISVDCSKSAKLCESLDVVSYPVIRLYHKDGRIDRYRGPRVAKEITAFLDRALRPTVANVNNQNRTEFVSADGLTFIADLPKGESRVLERFTELAKKYQHRYSFALSSAHGSQPVIVCHNEPEGFQQALTDFSSVNALESFVKRCSEPLIPQLTRRNDMRYFSTRKSIVHYFIKNEEEREAYVSEMRSIAKKYEDYLQFGTINVNEYPEMPPLFGFKHGASAVLAVQNPNDGSVFPYLGGKKVDAGTVEAFLMDIIEGKVNPWHGQAHGDTKVEGHDEL